MAYELKSDDLTSQSKGEKSVRKKKCVMKWGQNLKNVEYIGHSFKRVSMYVSVLWSERERVVDCQNVTFI